LTAQLPVLLRRYYARALALASDETGLKVERFPRDCPYTPEQILDAEFLPTRR